MTVFEELLSELGDYPQELLDFVNGESTAGWVDFADDEVKTRTYHQIATKALKALYKGEVDRVGKTVVNKMNAADVTWNAYLVWDGGLSLQSYGHLRGYSSKEQLYYAIAQLADICAGGKKKLIRCERKECKNYALKDKRGGGGNKHRWCSTRCRTTVAQRQKRFRDSEQKKHKRSTSSPYKNDH